MWSLCLVLLVLTSDFCLGRPQQQQQQQQQQYEEPQHHGSMAEIQAHGGALDQDSQHHQGLSPVRVQHRDINVINEPTCEELKAMWRFSKRQARAPEIINEISTYKDPFSYNEWAPYYSTSNAGYVSSSRSAGGSGGTRFRTGSSRRPVFGRVVHKAPLSSVGGFQGHSGRGYDQVARLYALQGESSRRPNVLRLPGGGIPAQTGRFQHLKEIIRTERARELQQQRAAEELAARAAALKEIAGGQRIREDYHNHGHKHRDYVRAPWGNPQQDLYGQSDDPSYYHTPRDRYSADAGSQQQSQDGMIAYPDPFAAPSRRSGMWQAQPQQILEHRNGAYDQQQSQQQQQQQQQEQQLSFDRRSGPFFPPSSMDAESNLDEPYIADPVMFEDPQLFMDPFLFNLHNRLDKTLLDGHAIRRSGSYLFN